MAQPGGQLAQIVSTLLTLPSLTVLPLLRRRVGFRLLKPGFIVLAVLFYGFVVGGGSVTGLLRSRMGGGGGVNSVALVGGWLLMLAFILGFAIVAGVQRRQGFQDLLMEQRWHPDGRGVSRLANLLPRMPLGRFQRFIEPVAVFAVGFILWRISGTASLGLWLMVAGVTLLLAESVVFERQINWICNEVASRLNAEVTEQEANAREVMESAARQTPAERQEVTSQPAGLAVEMRAQIEANRARLAQSGAILPPPMPPLSAQMNQASAGVVAAPAAATPGTPPPAPPMPAGIPIRRRPTAAGPEVPPADDGNQPPPGAKPGREFVDVLGEPPEGFEPFRPK